jgi:hypothetical protein
MSQLDSLRAFYQAEEDASNGVSQPEDDSPTFSVGPKGGYGEIGQPWGIPKTDMPVGARLCVHQPPSPDRVALCSPGNYNRHFLRRYYTVGVGDGVVVDRCSEICPKSPKKLAERADSGSSGTNIEQVLHQRRTLNRIG